MKLPVVGALDGHVKEPYKMPTLWEPDHRSTFFFMLPGNLCNVKYIRQIIRY